MNLAASQPPTFSPGTLSSQFSSHNHLRGPISLQRTSANLSHLFVPICRTSSDPILSDSTSRLPDLNDVGGGHLSVPVGDRSRRSLSMVRPRKHVWQVCLRRSILVIPVVSYREIRIPLRSECSTCLSSTTACLLDIPLMRTAGHEGVSFTQTSVKTRDWRSEPKSSHPRNTWPP